MAFRIGSNLALRTRFGPMPASETHVRVRIREDIRPIETDILLLFYCKSATSPISVNAITSAHVELGNLLPNFTEMLVVFGSSLATETSYFLFIYLSWSGSCSSLIDWGGLYVQGLPLRRPLRLFLFDRVCGFEGAGLDLVVMLRGQSVGGVTFVLLYAATFLYVRGSGRVVFLLRLTLCDA